MEVSIYEQFPGFPYCFEKWGGLFFAKEEVVVELEKMGIKVWKRRNYD